MKSIANTTILNFHGIGTPAASIPEDEVPYWVSESQFASIVEQAKQLTENGRQFMFTFDDGNRSDLEIACPALKDSGFRGTFFILTGRLGMNGYLSEADIAELISNEMEIGLHGRNHVDWRSVPADEFRDETVTAREELAIVCGKAIDTVSIPFGAYNRQVIHNLKQQKFRRVFTSDGGTTSTDAQIQERISIRGDMEPERIENILHARESAKAKIRRSISTKLRRYIL
ncbi:Polysaccharide deacetylase [Thalassoglobus neptunius]|uniref:Polysaccharide deacetylase n=1 Tax=Thalassoglobus neptunius TaxID=1938619 RepID=A0A5C5X424_9PLAN|nr:polysaccharide deacetylase family protein [Thalassoglobus neptunius]TWT57726.1 Polysaccharide deacetylase [Thalassoglobus neptunius]